MTPNPILISRLPAAHTEAKHFYSPSTKGFYLSTLHGDNIPNDRIEITVAKKEELMKFVCQGKVVTIDPVTKQITVAPTAPPTRESLIRPLGVWTQEYLDAFARTKGYDNIDRACSYAFSGVAAWAAEGSYCSSARDAAWQHHISTLAQLMADTKKPVPTKEQYLASLPVLAWPA